MAGSAGYLCGVPGKSSFSDHLVVLAPHGGVSNECVGTDGGAAGLSFSGNGVASS